MEQYISKSALVAEVMNRIKELQNLHKENEEKLDSIQKTSILLCIDECKVILSFLDTLEVKEVDFEEETDKWYNNEASKEFENVLYKDIEKCAKHFFELGMQVSNKAQKGEEV